MTEQEARAEQGYTEVDPFDLSDDQSDEVTALAEATVERDALARAYDPDAFTDRALDQTRHAGAVIQWAARRHLAVEAADRVIASGILAERSRVVVAAPSDTDREALIETISAAMHGAWDDAREYEDAPTAIADAILPLLARASQPVQVEVTAAMIERAAKAWHEYKHRGQSWDDIQPQRQAHWKRVAQSALVAALGGGE